MPKILGFLFIVSFVSGPAALAQTVDHTNLYKGIDAAISEYRFLVPAFHTKYPGYGGITREYDEIRALELQARLRDVALTALGQRAISIEEYYSICVGEPAWRDLNRVKRVDSGQSTAQCAGGLRSEN